ncbi:GIN domain-containing protein [Aquimarina sp. AU474]|uniref:GIN domain-containing protein n=1 Tax=Aquimarina sp. AU474 TaxID=2108529 RepID=UPI000D696717|nr:DUF2807 domain-containing protein [Aquimarina sp. AU474]
MKKSKLMILIALSVVLFFFLSFQLSIHRNIKKGAIPEDSAYIRKNIDVEHFTKINLDHYINVVFKQDSTQQILINAPENLMPYIDVQVLDNELTIKKTKRTSSEDSIVILITNNQLDQLVTNTGVSFETKGKVHGKNLQLEFGSNCTGRLELSYSSVMCKTAKNATIKITGNSNEIDFSN